MKSNCNVKKLYLILEQSWLLFGDIDPPRDKGKAEATTPNRLRTRQGCTNPGHLVAVATKFFTVIPNTSCSSVWNLFHVTIPKPRIRRWPLDIVEKMYTPSTFIRNIT